MPAPHVWAHRHEEKPWIWKLPKKLASTPRASRDALNTLFAEVRAGAGASLACLCAWSSLVGPLVGLAWPLLRGARAVCRPSCLQGMPSLSAVVAWLAHGWHHAGCPYSLRTQSKGLAQLKSKKQKQHLQECERRMQASWAWVQGTPLPSEQRGSSGRSRFGK